MASVGMESLQELEARCQAAKKRKAELKALERAQRRNEAKRSKRKASHLAEVLHEAGDQGQCPKLDAQVQAQLLMLLELAGADADIVTSFALGQGRLLQCSPSGLDQHDHTVREAISGAVASMHLASPDSFMVDASYVHGKDSEIQSLGRYVVERKLWTWLLEQNCSRGVSPGAGLVREMASKFIPDQLPSHIRHVLKSLFLSGSRAGRYWVVSFQKRWDAKMGGLGIGVDLEPEVLEQKEPWLGFRTCWKTVCFGPSFP